MSKTVTDFLTSKSGFIDGMATIADLSGNFHSYYKIKDPEVADQEAIMQDWQVVGQDLRWAYATEKAKSK